MLISIQRNDYWNAELKKLVSVYTGMTKKDFETMTAEVRSLVYNVVTFGNKMREFETDDHFIILERR